MEYVFQGDAVWEILQAAAADKEAEGKDKDKDEDERGQEEMIVEARDGTIKFKRKDGELADVFSIPKQMLKGENALIVNINSPNDDITSVILNGRKYPVKDSACSKITLTCKPEDPPCLEIEYLCRDPENPE